MSANVAPQSTTMETADSSAGRSLGACPREVTPAHLQRLAVVYIRQSSPGQVRDHAGSAAAQRDLAALATRWGWPPSRIRVIDCDLGVSAKSASNRRGYLELLREEVGILFFRDVPRLSRNLRDFAEIAELAKETDTVLCENGVVVEPDSLGLQVKALFATHDNKERSDRALQTRIALARLGRAVSPPPIGYVRASNGDWSKDPDRKVQDAIRLVFELYPRLGSLGKVVAHFREHGLEFPRRFRGRVKWGPIDPALLDNVLRNPAYAGDYVFRRFQSKKRPGTTGRRVTRRSPDNSIPTRDHHEAYVPREAWQRIQEMLSQASPRRQNPRPIVGRGNAVLQGLLRCGVDGCDRPMKTLYPGRDGLLRTATYTCRHVDGWGGTTHRVTVPARFIDAEVVHHVLDALTEIDHETARAVIEKSQLEHAATQRALARQRLDAQEDMERLRRAVVNMPSEFQDARADLLHEYNAAARRFNELGGHGINGASLPVSLTRKDIEELVDRSKNIRQLWTAPRRTSEDHKRVLRIVLSAIVVRRADRESADIELVWQGGLRESLQVRRPRGVDTFVLERTLQGQSPARIVSELNAAGTVTASGRPISANVVHQKLGRQGLRLKHERARPTDHSTGAAR